MPRGADRGMVRMTAHDSISALRLCDGVQHHCRLSSPHELSIGLMPLLLTHILDLVYTIKSVSCNVTPPVLVRLEPEAD